MAPRVKWDQVIVSFGVRIGNVRVVAGDAGSSDWGRPWRPV